MPVSLTIRRLREKKHEFGDDQDYIANPDLLKKPVIWQTFAYFDLV